VRVLVTGAAGFIGANIVRGFAARGARVAACVRPGSDHWRLAGAACSLHEVDVSDPATFSTTFEAVAPDVAVSAAAHGAYSWQDDLSRMLAVNVAAVDHLIDLCLERGTPLIHLGSSSEYGPQPGAPDEMTRPAPNSAYAVTKLAGTHLLCDAVVRRGLVGVVLRLYSVYGPWEEPARLMPTLAAALVEHRLPPLVDPAIARDFVHVNDVVDLVVGWASRPVVPRDLPIVNLGSGVQTSIGELVDLARSIVEVKHDPTWGSMDNRAWDTTTWRADARRAAEVLGWRASTSLTDGLRSLMTFVAAHERYPGPA
jgi:nucleoside-diphosphate-sugar epimerase